MDTLRYEVTPMPTRKPRVNITFEDDAFENLKFLSQSLDMPMSRIVKELVEPMLKETQSVLSIVQSINSDKKRLSDLEKQVDSSFKNFAGEYQSLLKQMKIED